MSWRVYTDDGSGVTKKSLEVWKSCKGKLGSIYHIVVNGTPTSNGRVFCTEIFAENGFVLLSGCNCGYYGTGPSGTSSIFDDLGIPCEEHIMTSDTIVWNERQSQKQVIW